MGSHHKWRAQAKKMRRKRIRQKLAQERDNLILKEHEEREKSPHFQAWFSEQKALELFAKEEEARQSAERHAAWVAEEARAQKAWRERQERLAMARAERAKQELRIKEEWEEEQLKLKAAKEEKERIAQEKHQKQEDLMRQIENFINKGCDMPMEVNVASETNPDRQPCPFFTKTGACRFGDRCSRNHMRPAISRVLIVPNFYDHIGLRQMNPDELEAADDWLEYEDAETYHNFLLFYEDVLPEWERVGKISQFKVCCNFEPHLRGNVYVEYESAQHAVQAFKKFHGRFYGGKQINVEFANIDSWKSAICGQFHKQCCPKGRACNFLHVFRNPGNAFHAADRDRQEWRLRLQRTERSTPTSPRRCRDRSWSNSPENSSRRKDWRWSVSPSPPAEVNISSWHRSSRDQSQHNYKEDFSPRRRRSSRRERSRSKDKSGRSSHISDRFRTRKGHSSRHDIKVHSSKRDSQNKSRDSDDHNFRRKTKDKDIPENQRLIEVCAKVPLGAQEASNCVNGKSSSESKRNSVCDTSLNFSSSVIDIATNFTSISQNDSSLSNAENIDGVDSHNIPSEKVTLKERKSRKKKKVYRKKKRKRKVSVKSDSSSSSDTSDEVK